MLTTIGYKPLKDKYEERVAKTHPITRDVENDFEDEDWDGETPASHTNTETPCDTNSDTEENEEMEVMKRELLAKEAEIDKQRKEFDKMMIKVYKRKLN